MTDDTRDEPADDRRSRGREMMRRVYGWEVPDVPGDHFAMTVDHLFADIWSRPALTLRDRRLMLLAALAAQGKLDVAEIQIGAALRNGEFDAEQLHEIALFLCYYIGWPTGTALDGIVGKVVRQARKHSPDGGLRDAAAAMGKQERS
jgi:4-carboxymuconolactone decarboxylase